MCVVVDLTWLIQRRGMAWMTGPIRSVVAQRAGLGGHLGTSERKRWLHFERLGGVCRECLTQAVYLLLHLRHGK